jgi:Tfp pilus assembly protein PilX
MSKTNRNNRKRKQRTHEEGVALIAAMLTLLLISAITAGIIILSNTETNTSANFRDEQRAFFSAKAGIEEARDRLRTAATNTVAGLLPTVLPGGSNSVLYITNANPLLSETVAPWTAPTTSSPNAYADDEICKETSTMSCSGGYPSGSGWYRTTTASSTYAASPVLDWKWARIQLKQSNAFGTNYAVNGNTANAYYTCLKDGSPYEVAFSTPCATPAYLPVYVITTLAVTQSGTRRMVQTEVGQDTIQFVAPSALTMDGSGPSFSGGNSNNFGVSGVDHGGCGSTTIGASVPAVGVVTAADVATVSSNADIPNKNQDNYTGSGYNGTTGTAPDVENVSTGMATDLTTPANLQDLVSTLKGDVTQPVINGPSTKYSGGGAALDSSQASPQIVYVNGDLTLDGSSTGYGILIVTGTLTLKGTVAWNGLILVVGKGNFQMDGTNTVNGAVLVADTTNSSGALLSVNGPPTYGVNGGGNATGGIYYSASCLTNGSQLTTFHVISMRELMN